MATSKQIRGWAATQVPPIDVKPNGRIPADVLAAFTAATGEGQTPAERTVYLHQAQAKAKAEPAMTNHAKLAELSEPAWITDGRAYAQELAQIRIRETERKVSA